MGQDRDRDFGQGVGYAGRRVAGQAPAELGDHFAGESSVVNVVEKLHRKEVGLRVDWPRQPDDAGVIRDDEGAVAFIGYNIGRIRHKLIVKRSSVPVGWPHINKDAYRVVGTMAGSQNPLWIWKTLINARPGTFNIYTVLCYFFVI